MAARWRAAGLFPALSEQVDTKAIRAHFHWRREWSNRFRRCLSVIRSSEAKDSTAIDRGRIGRARSLLPWWSQLLAIDCAARRRRFANSLPAIAGLAPLRD